ncbi:hypothetical protein DFS34DRAFT_645374 [Phlyctochytrium arcticum]|nr:hypothetical protein DFS34DRAFT_645374 [Phlyctochytrium arcticum]
MTLHPRNFVRAEVLKFGIYIFFPVGTLYLFNRPELQQYFGASHVETINSFRVPEEELFKLPKDLEGVREERRRLKEVYERRRKEDGTS